MIPEACYLKTLRELVLLELPAHDKAAAGRLEQTNVKLALTRSAKSLPKRLEAVDLRSLTPAEAETKP